MDSTNYVHDIRLNDATWGNGVGSTGLVFDGTSSASTSDAVLYSDQSFTVDVWAKLNAAGTAGTIVAQRGPSGVDPFTLRYDGAQWSAVVRVVG